MQQIVAPLAEGDSPTTTATTSAPLTAQTTDRSIALEATPADLGQTTIFAMLSPARCNFHGSIF